MPATSRARALAFLRTLTTDGADGPAFLLTSPARRAIREAVVFCALAGFAFALLYLAIGPAEFVVPNTGAGVLLLVVAADRGRHPVRQVYAAVAVALVLFGIELSLVGQIDNGITVWFIVPNVAVMLLGMRRAATLCAIATVAELASITLAVWAGLIHPVATLHSPDLIMVLSMVGVLCVCGVMALFGYNSRLRLLAEVQRQNVALAAALDESRDARNEALEASRAKDRFFANLTHEIRTPLAGIAGSAELLAQGALPSEERQLADSLLSSTRSLATLVNGMLDHARLAAGHSHVELGQVALRGIGEELVNLFARFAETQALRLQVTVRDDVPDLVMTDGMRLRQVLVNLVSNAVKFTERGEVTVVLAWQEGGEPTTGTIVATVTDTGPGIAPELRQAVFEPFVQGDTSIRRSHSGTGLGLAIARQVVGLLGGTIALSSELGVGSEFTVMIPATVVAAEDRPSALDAASATASSVIAGPSPSGSDGSPAASASAPGSPRVATPGDDTAPGGRGVPGSPTAWGAPAASGIEAARGDGLRGLRVLLVEDNPTNRVVATAMLRRSGVDVVPAANGHEAIELAAAERVDLVLMDLQMPVLDGIEASRRIRAAERERRGPRLPIVAMTGNAPEDYADVCEAAGMDGFVTKPVTLDQLHKVLVGTLARSSAWAQAEAAAVAD